MSNTGRRGSVKQADNGTWYFILDVPTLELGANGKPKRKQERKRGFPTRRAAQAALTEKLNSVATQTYVAPKRQTLGAFITETWLPAIKPRVKQSTYESYERVARLHTRERPIGMMQLQDVDGAALNAHYAILLAGDDKHLPLSRKTTRYCGTVLHQVFRDAIKWRYLMVNPSDQSDKPKPSASPEMTTWKPEQLLTFLQGACEHRMMGAFWLLGTTGMRRGEALGLKWADIDLDAGLLAIRRTLVDQNVAPSWRWESTKTRSSMRTIALDDALVEALRAHRAKQNAERLALGAGWVDMDLVNPGPTGAPIPPRRLTEQFNRLSARLELPHIRLHDLRHTYATLALGAGIHPKIVQERLGHSKISVTMDTYSHVDIDMQADAAAKISRLIQGEK